MSESKPRKRGSTWDEDSLRRAIEAVQNNQLNTNAAALKFNIPRRTLRNHLVSGNSNKIIGKTTILTKQLEEDLSQRIKGFAELGIPLTPKFIRKQAFLFCERFKIKHSFNMSTRMAGRKWLKMFLARNPSISIMNAAKAQKMNNPIVKHEDKTHRQPVLVSYSSSTDASDLELDITVNDQCCHILPSTVHRFNDADTKPDPQPSLYDNPFPSTSGLQENIVCSSSESALKTDKPTSQRIDNYKRKVISSNEPSPQTSTVNNLEHKQAAKALNEPARKQRLVAKKRMSRHDDETDSEKSYTANRLESTSTVTTVMNTAGLCEDEFHFFGMNVAAQLRRLPLHIALQLQTEFQNTLYSARVGQTSLTGGDIEGTTMQTNEGVIDSDSIDHDVDHKGFSLDIQNAIKRSTGSQVSHEENLFTKAWDASQIDSCET